MGDGHHPSAIGTSTVQCNGTPTLPKHLYSAMGTFTTAQAGLQQHCPAGMAPPPVKIPLPPVVAHHTTSHQSCHHISAVYVAQRRIAVTRFLLHLLHRGRASDWGSHLLDPWSHFLWSLNPQFWPPVICATIMSALLNKVVQMKHWTRVSDWGTHLLDPKSHFLWYLNALISLCHLLHTILWALLNKMVQMKHFSAPLREMLQSEAFLLCTVLQDKRFKLRYKLAGSMILFFSDLTLSSLPLNCGYSEENIAMYAVF